MRPPIIHEDVNEALKRQTAYAYWQRNSVEITNGHRLQAPVDTGLLVASHILEPPERTPYGFVLRLLVKAPYAVFVHGGHGWIYPKVAKALRWVTKAGVVVFAKRVRPLPGNPWTVRAWIAMGFKKVKLIQTIVKG